MRSKLVVSFIAVSLGLLWASPQASHAAPEDHVTLLGTLAEWRYPDSNFGGASMSDAGDRRPSLKCQALLTTGDSFEKVTKYYVEHFVSRPQSAETKANAIDAQSVSTQDDSQDRPIKLQVIVVNRATTSTTLVISRAKGEKQTHIAWSHYMRLDRDR
jgi:hypothetical protein